jgi:hypothetical protein
MTKTILGSCRMDAIPLVFAPSGGCDRPLPFANAG